MAKPQPDHEFMDTGALTDDAVPEQPPVEAPDSPALADENLTGAEPSSGVAGEPDDIVPENVELT